MAIKILSLGTYITIFMLGMLTIPITLYLNIDKTWLILAPIGVWGMLGFVIPMLAGMVEEIDKGFTNKEIANKENK